MSVVIGVDSSTQSTKVEARDLETGTVVARGSAPHPPTRPPVSEQEPDAWWQALIEACDQLGPARRDAVAISVAGQQHGLVLVGDDGQTLRPAKLWNDTTSAASAEQIVARLGAEVWANACGSVPVAAFTVAKLAWFAEHEPHHLSRVAKVMLPHDWITWRLTRQHVTDRGDASGTGWFDPARGSYRPELVQAALADHGEDLDTDPTTWLPAVLGPAEPAGALTSEAARQLGLPTGVVVGPGTGDNMAAALGIGVAEGDLVVSLGTSGTVYARSSTPTNDRTGAVAGFADATGEYLPLVCTLNATGVTDTVAQWLGTDAAGLSDLALQADPARVGPLLVPYFDGERTPNLPHASGSWHGLRRTTTRSELALAAHDGVLGGLLDGRQRLIDCGVRADGRVFLVGGGARSAAYRQRAADLAGRPVVVPDGDEAVAAGAALQAAGVVGSATLDQIRSSWGFGQGTEIDPRDVDAEAFHAAYERAARAALGDPGRAAEPGSIPE